MRINMSTPKRPSGGIPAPPAPTRLKKWGKCSKVNAPPPSDLPRINASYIMNI